jgi:hypothetical protein
MFTAIPPFPARVTMLAAADIEGHSTTAKFSQPGRLSAGLAAVAFTTAPAIIGAASATAL